MNRRPPTLREFRCDVAEGAEAAIANGGPDGRAYRGFLILFERATPCPDPGCCICRVKR